MAEKIKINDEIEIPSGISVSFDKDLIVMKKDNTTVSRKLNSLVSVKIDGNKIKLEALRSTKRERKIFGSIRSHIKNIIEGLEKPWVYKLQIATVHFPTTASIDKANKEFVLKNFLGEKKDRKIKLDDNVDIKINKDIIEITCADVEKAGQAAANLEKLTKVRNRDRRIFQDGIFIIEKPGKVFI